MSTSSFGDLITLSNSNPETIDLPNGHFGSGISAASGVFNSLIEINQGNSGGSMLLIHSRNHNTGTQTFHGIYLIQFYHDGDNAPAIIHLHGDNQVTFGSTGTPKTLTMKATDNTGNNIYFWMRCSDSLN